jgi:hypothetical protein
MRRDAAEVLLGVLCSVSACRASSPELSLNPLPAIRCYQLEFGRWAAADTTLAFGAALVGLYTPLPRIIALVTDARRTGNQAVVLRLPRDSSQLLGTWSQGHDTLFSRLPSPNGGALMIRLLGTDPHLEGGAWIAHGPPSDNPLPTPGASLSADRVACPELREFDAVGA